MATKHMVICVQCGKRFDVNNGGYYNQQSRRYTCKKCGKAQIATEKKINADLQAKRNMERTGMKQSYKAMILKIVIGLFIVSCGFSSPEGGWTFGYFLFTLIFGGLVIAWGLVPYLKARKEKNTKSSDVLDF